MKVGVISETSNSATYHDFECPIFRFLWANFDANCSFPRNLGIIFDSTLLMSDHISSVYKSCFLSIRDLRRIRNTLYFSTARTIATSLIHSKLDYCNSPFLNLPQSQLGRLRLILNSSARAVFKTPKFAISTAFSMFNLTALLAILTSSLCNVLQSAHVLN